MLMKFMRCIRPFPYTSSCTFTTMIVHILRLSISFKVKQMLSCYEGVTSHTVLACFLVYEGADIYIKNNSGITALQKLPIEITAIVATFAEKHFK